MSTQSVPAPRPPFNLDHMLRQLAGITEVLRTQVWEKKSK
jgi:hypothetical protein